MMHSPLRLSGIGIVCSQPNGVQAADRFGDRLSTTLSALLQGRSPMRLFHPIEEMAVLAACDALALGGMTLPVGGEDVGIALGVEEGIDGIKARYFEGVLRDGPLGASPMAFPLTAPSTVAARISILLDLRGESITVCGGSLSGAQAIGLAMGALREGRCRGVLAGGATSVEREFLEALRRIGRPDGGQARSGACLLLLESEVSEHSGTAEVLGYGEGFGRDEVRDAVQACLEDAGLLPEQIASVWVASVQDPRYLSQALQRMVATAPIVWSPAADLYSASFPMALADAATQVANGTPQPVLVVGTDCLAGASAALVRSGDRR
jgi:beta-ketoacyl synthase-like protein